MGLVPNNHDMEEGTLEIGMGKFSVNYRLSQKAGLELRITCSDTGKKKKKKKKKHLKRRKMMGNDEFNRLNHLF
jgi:hypothetical protein